MLSLDFIEPDFDRRNQFARERFADGSTTDLFGQLLRSKQTFPSRVSTLTFGHFQSFVDVTTNPSKGYFILPVNQADQRP